MKTINYDSLFANPQQLENDYLGNRMISQQDFVRLAPLQQLIALSGNAGAMVGNSVGSMMGMEAPGVREARGVEEATKSLDWSNPDELEQAAKQLAQIDRKAALQLMDTAKQVRLDQRQKTKLDREVGLEKAVAALPADASEEDVAKAMFPYMSPQERADYATKQANLKKETTRQANQRKLIDSQFPSLSPELKEFVLDDPKLVNQMLDAATRGAAERAKFQAGLPSEFDKKKTGGVSSDGSSTNSRGVKAPSGYQWTAGGAGLEPIPGGPADKGGTGGGKSVEGLQENIRSNELFKATAQEAMRLIDSGKPTGSGIEKIWDAGNRFVGRPTEGGMGAQQLKVLAGRLTSAVPRMQGPQSDKDVQLYREMAGQVGDESLTLDERKAALEVVLELVEKYDTIYAQQLEEAQGAGAPTRANAARRNNNNSGGGGGAIDWSKYKTTK